MSPPFGSFSPLCSSSDPFGASPLPHCNLFFRSLSHVTSPPALTILFPQDGAISGRSSLNDLVVGRDLKRAGVGVGEECDLRRMGVEGGLGDLASIISSAICLLSILYLIARIHRRRAAVGRVELRFLFLLFAVFLGLQIPTIGGILQQGASALAVLSAIQVGLIAGMAWILLANAIVATQLVEDDSPSSLIPIGILLIIFTGITIYISLDQAFGISPLFVLSYGRPEAEELRNIALFCLGILWPAVAVVAYFLLMTYVVRFRLRETKPLLWFWLSFALIVASLVVLILASQPLCRVSNSHLTSAFLSTLLATAAMWALFYAWTSITEAEWEEDPYY